MTPDEAARRAAVVAKVGSKAITLGELEDKLSAVPTFQRATFGKSDAEIRERFLNDVIIADVLVAEAAEKNKMSERVDVRMRLARARAGMTLRAARSTLPSAASLSKEAVEKYYQAHLDQFDTKERMQLWRILVKTEAEAKEVLELAKKDGTPKEWSRLAREKSLDKATNLRNGNLGFVTADGTAAEAGIRIAPAVAAAAVKVKDGEFVPQPIAEGDFFAIVWRRGSTPAKKQTAAQADAEIRDAIVREAVEQSTKGLIDSLRAKKVSGVDHAGLASFDIQVGDATISVRKNIATPPVVPPPRATPSR